MRGILTGTEVQANSLPRYTWRQTAPPLTVRLPVNSVVASVEMTMFFSHGVKTRAEG